MLICSTLFFSLCPLDETEDNSFLSKLKNRLKKFWKRKDKDSTGESKSESSAEVDSAQIETEKVSE